MNQATAAAAEDVLVSDLEFAEMSSRPSQQMNDLTEWWERDPERDEYYDHWPRARVGLWAGTAD